MHVLHGAWLIDSQQFILWGEDTGREPTYRKGRRGSTSPHPFALSMDDLLRYIDRFTTESEPSGRAVNIWLPGKGKKAQPSPPAEATGVPVLPDTMKLLAWELDVITLHPTDYLDMMLQLPTDPRHFELGSDLFFWQQVGLLIMNGLVEGRYLPALEERGTQLRAYWQARPDQVLFEQLLANMPPLCRAMVDEIDFAPSPFHLLEFCLNTVTDAFIREMESSRFPRTAHPWLIALTTCSSVVVDSPAKNKKLWQN